MKFLLAVFIALAPAARAQAPCPLSTLEPTDPDDDARFGWAVDGEEDLFVVGAPKEDEGATNGGAAYLFRFNGSGWSQEAKLLASDAATSDRFGWSVSVDSNRALIGSPRKNVVGSESGAAYLFSTDGTIWGESLRFQPSNPAIDARFGEAVALSGGVAFVGAPGTATAALDAGSVYAFRLLGTQWTQVQEVVAPDAVSGAGFGTAVAAFGQRLAVGAPADTEFGSSAGAAYVFRFDGTEYVLEAKLRSAMSASSARAGQSVDLSGTGLIVGAYLDSTPSGISGSATVFRRAGTMWTEEQRLFPTSSSGTPFYGFSAAIDGEQAIVGAYRDDFFSPQLGSATLHRLVQGTWQETQRYAPTDAAADDHVGYAVAAFDNRALVGSWGTDLGSEDEAGRALAIATLPDCSGIESQFCFGDGGDQMGCTPCPCGNEALPGTPAGCLNGSGTSARLTATGVASFVADSLRVEVSGATPDAFGLLIAAPNRLPASPANPCFALASGNAAPNLDGLRCVGGGARRLGARATDANGSIGVTTPGWGAPDGPSGGLAQALQIPVGQATHLQVFYRENPAQGCMTGQNTTQGQTVRYVP